MRTWGRRRWGAAAASTAVVYVVVAVPTGVVSTPFYTRMTPVFWWNYPILAATALLSGLVAATYVHPAAPPSGAGKLGVGGVLSGLAVGCPVCNKLIVALIGVSGALNI